MYCGVGSKMGDSFETFFNREYVPVKKYLLYMGAASLGVAIWRS